MDKICQLCKINKADKENSHIIPKFMAKRLFEGTKPRHTLSITKEGRQRKIQDTPKENNILCKDCEKKIEIIETYFSKVFIDLNSLQNAKRKYTLHKIDDEEVIICEDLNPTVFKLFIYSLIWRSSISRLLEFDTFKLDSYVEEELRIFLNDNLRIKHSDLFSSLSQIENIPQYHTCLIKPKNKTRGLFTAYQFEDNAYAIYSVDYVLFFYTNHDIIVKKHLQFTNVGNNNVIVVNGDDDAWRELNNQVLTNMLNYNKN